MIVAVCIKTEFFFQTSQIFYTETMEEILLRETKAFYYYCSTKKTLAMSEGKRTKTTHHFELEACISMLADNKTTALLQNFYLRVFSRWTE